jgi:hypothetical protein
MFAHMINFLKYNLGYYLFKMNFILNYTCTHCFLNNVYIKN